MRSGERLIVTVCLDGVTTTWDIEAPVDLPAAELGQAIAETLAWTPQPYVVFAEPPGRVLDPLETLAEAGVSDGAWLKLRPGLHQEELREAGSQRAVPGYVWKRIDDV